MGSGPNEPKISPRGASGAADARSLQSGSEPWQAYLESVTTLLSD